MTSKQPGEASRTLDYELFQSALQAFGSSQLFRDPEDWINHDNPYRRAIRPQVFGYLDFSKPLARDQLLEYTSLAANRLLLTVYEQDFLLLPQQGFSAKRADYEAFYQDPTKALGEVLRPFLERYLFTFLDSEISITGAWTARTAASYFEDARDRCLAGDDNPAMNAILGSADRQHAARTFLIQLAGDFLVESSAMARNLLGSYGPLQSELFKVVIDEFGYGVHEKKHSTLFQRILRHYDLHTDVHCYWQFYLSSSLLLNNYYNWICRDHSRFFRYLGAIYFAETTFIKTCRQMADMLRSVFGADSEVEYFLEHVHIDAHHSRMVYDKLVAPAIDEFGVEVIPDIVRGFEESKLLAELADSDFCEQVSWADQGKHFKALHDPIFQRIQQGTLQPPVQTFVEPRHELSVTHVHDGDELCHIESGTMHFYTGLGRYTPLHAGEGTVIQRNRLHGAIIDSDECVYHIHTIRDHKACLS